MCFKLIFGASPVFEAYKCIILRALEKLFWNHLRVSIFILSRVRYWRKTDCDLMWPQITFHWPPIISCTRIITYGVSGYDPERIVWFRLVYAKRGAFSYLPHRPVIGRSRKWPPHRSPEQEFQDTRFIGNDVLIPAWKFHTDFTSTVAMAWWQTFFEGGLASSPGDLTWPDPEPNIL